jgi:anaerobic ribonucleoside-triphosphate reductase activating protein
MLRIADTIKESVVDGPGVRYVIFTQGCPHHCKDCHNPQTWNPEGGYEVTVEELINDIGKYVNLIDGITISGGEPFLQTKECLKLVREVKNTYPKLTIVLYTGYTIEKLSSDSFELLKEVNILIDGPFVHTLKRELPFRGSTNQRCIKIMTKSL